MSKEAIHSKHAPTAIGPYSQAIGAGATVYLSGQIGLDPATGNLVEGVEAQAHQEQIYLLGRSIVSYSDRSAVIGDRILSVLGQDGLDGILTELKAQQAQAVL